MTHTKSMFLWGLFSLLAMPVFAQSVDSSFYRFVYEFFSDSLYANDTAEGGDANALRREALMWGPRLYPYGTYDKAGEAMHSYVENFLQNGATASKGVGDAPPPDWELIGPIGRGNYIQTDGIGRIHRVVFDPNYDGLPVGQGGNQTVYAVSSFGGLWRSLDDGENWSNLNTDLTLPFINVSDVVIDPTDTDIIYISTGLADERAGTQYEHMTYSTQVNLFAANAGDENALVCHGVYRSKDGGTTWVNISRNSNGPNFVDLVDEFKHGGTIRNMEINPLVPSELFLATSRGVFRTVTANAPSPQMVSWTRVYEDPDVVGNREFRGLAYKPGSSGTIYASGTDIFRSTDHGVNWQSITGAATGLDFDNLFGIPDDFRVLRINIAHAPSNAQRLYAYIMGAEKKAGVDQWRRKSFIYEFNEDPNHASGIGSWTYRHDWTDNETKDDGTGDWSGMNGFERQTPRRMPITVSPINENEVYFGYTVVMGTNNIQVNPFTNRSGYNTDLHADIHDLNFPPAWQPVQAPLWTGTDGGVSVRNANTWDDRSRGLAVAKIWSFDDSEADPYLTMSGLQDVGEYMSSQGVGDTYQWQQIHGGDGYAAKIDDQSGRMGFSNLNGHTFPFFSDLPNTGQEDLYPCRPFLPSPPFSSTRTYLPTAYDMENHPQTGNMFFGFGEVFELKELEEDCTDIDWEAQSNIGTALGWNQAWRLKLNSIAIAPSNGDYIYAAFAGATHSLIQASGGGNFETNFINPYLFLIRPSEPCNSQAICPNVVNLRNPLKAALGLTFNDDGQIKEFMPSITDLAVDPKNHQRLWVSFSGYEAGVKVWYTEDAGQTWQNADPNGDLKNLPVNAIEYVNGSEDCLIVGTDAGVYVKSDANSGWQKYGKLLPNVRVLELKVNSCAGRIRAATYGRGLWETELEIPTFLAKERVINGKETWSEDRNLTGNLRIPYGGVLTLTGTLNMPVNGRIRIERGGKLIVNGGTITNQCDKIWYGIEVYGDPTKAHPDLTTALAVYAGSNPQPTHPDHGVVVLQNGAVLEHAQNAVTLIRKDETIGSVLAQSGGIIVAKGATFRNNRRSIEFMKFRPAQSGAASDDNTSLIQGCTFIHTPETRIPYDDVISFVSLWEVAGVELLGNQFINDVPGPFGKNDQSVGVYSIDAGYTIGGWCTSYVNNPTPPVPVCSQYDPNFFQNLTKGVVATASLAFDDPIVIDRNEFENCEYGNHLVGIHTNLQCTRNTFTNSAVGTYLLSCTGFLLSDNAYLYTGSGTYGIGQYIRNTGITNHETYRNSFESLDFGATAMLDNTGLQLKCNDFSSIQSKNILDDGLSLPDQGFCVLDQFDPDFYSAPAGNRINDGLCLSSQEDHLFASPYLSGYVYSHHSGVDFTPTCYSLNITANNCLTPYDPELSCPDQLEDLNNGNGDIKGRLQTLNTELGQSIEDPAYRRYLHSQRDITTQRLLQYYLLEGQSDSALFHLDGDTSRYATATRLGWLIESGDYSAALEAINSFPQLSGEDSSWLALHQWLLAIRSDNRTYFEMSDGEENTLRQIALENTPASANAQAILHLVKGDALPDEVNLPASARFQNPASDEFSLSQAGFVLFPNPAKKQVSIRYQLPLKTANAILSLSTLHGQIVEQETVNLQEGEISWQLGELAPGIYVVQMQAGKEILRVQKLIVQP